MSPASLTTLALFLSSSPLACAAQSYTVWASVVFARTGEHTPEFFPIPNANPGELTPLGAQQAYSVGSFFRNRYLTASNASQGIGGNPAPMPALNPNRLDSTQMYIESMDEQYTDASAQAFMQGLYPPTTANSNSSKMLLSTGALANGTYLDNPLSGYQYPSIHTVDVVDFTSNIPVGGVSHPGDCNAWTAAAISSEHSAWFQQTAHESQPLYRSVAGSITDGVLPGSDQIATFYNAYPFYEYMSYLNNHNSTIASQLQQAANSSGPSPLQRLQWYADEVTWAQNGNLNTPNNYTQAPQSPWGSGTIGSISTISGNYLAAKALLLLQQAILYQGQYPATSLSVSFGDFRNMVSFFALAGLPNLNSNFYGMPAFGSVMAFELFSMTNSSTNATFPTDPSQLFVQFFFRNGTDLSTNSTIPNNNYQAYPLFGNGPSETPMPWTQFEDSMSQIMLYKISDWCTQCASAAIFCAPYNNTISLLANPNFSSPTPPSSHALSAGAAAGIAFAATSVFLAGTLLAIMFFFGVRFHRVTPVKSSKKEGLGGFKGSQKLASDRDLTLPKGGVVVNGASVERPAMGHERTGSWELRQAGGAGHQDMLEVPGGATVGRVSFESLVEGRAPVRAEERV